VQQAEARQARPATDIPGLALVPNCDTEAPDALATGAASTAATGDYREFAPNPRTSIASLRIDAGRSDSRSSIDVATILEGSTDIETGVAPDADIVTASNAGGLGDVDSPWSRGDGASTSFSATDVVARPDADQDGGLLGIYLDLDAGRGGGSLSKDGRHDYRDRA
jgi:hypothetical protein